MVEYIKTGYRFEIDKQIGKMISPSTRKIIFDNKPNFGSLDQRVRVVGLVNEGNSFEPRLKVSYDVWLSGVKQARYEHTIILDEHSDDVAAII